MAPIHSRMEKPPKSWRQNLTHSGVVGGGVRVFGPSLARFSTALALVRPWGRAIFRNKCLSAVTGNLITTQWPSFHLGLKSNFTAVVAEHQVSPSGLFKMLCWMYLLNIFLLILFFPISHLAKSRVNIQSAMI